MKQIKKIISLFFAFAMVLSCIDMPLAIKADEEHQTTAQITMEEVESSNDLFSNTIVEVVGDLEIYATQQVDEQGEKVALVVTASTSNENRNIIQARAPNGKIIQGDTISYLAPCNGTYEFEFTYEENGVEKTQLHYVYIFDSKLMSDGKAPSKSNGFMNAADFTSKQSHKSSYAADIDKPAASGSINTKLYPYNVTVDGQKMGPGNLHYVAYMQDNNAEAVLCMNPTLNAPDDFSAFDAPQKISFGNTFYPGKGGSQIQHQKLSLIWYYSQIMGKTQGEPSGMSGDEWTFVCQIMLWDALGWKVSDYDGRFQTAITWVNTQVEDHKLRIKQGYDDQLEIWTNEPWDAGTETIFGTGGTCSTTGDKTTCKGGLVDMNGKVNTAGGQYVKFDSEKEVINFGDPLYIWGDASNPYTILLTDKDIDPEDPTKGQAKQVTGTEGGSVSIRHKDAELMNDFKSLFTRSSSNLTVTYGNNNGVVYNFTRKGALKKTDVFEELEVFMISQAEEVNIGESYLFSGGNPIPAPDEPQPLMQFRLPVDTNKGITFRFSEEPDAKVTPPPTVVTPKELIAPIIEKVDEEGNADGVQFPIQGATFTFHAGEKYEIHFQKDTAFDNGESVCDEDGNCSWIEDWQWKDEWSNTTSGTVFSNNEELFEEVTPQDGRIDTTPIIQMYYDKAQQVIDDKVNSSDGSPGRGAVRYRHHEEYVDKEGTQWEGGKFYAKEPTTSQKIMNGGATSDFVGYLNLFKWERVNFNIEVAKGGAGSTDQPVITHTNKRQKARISQDKIDAESTYLNHNNDHEPQGDSYFYGSVFIYTAREDIKLHDGSIPNSPFTGKPLVKGEVVDVVVMELPFDEDGNFVYTATERLASGTTQMLELGQYAFQEVRLPGVYQYDIPMALSDYDGLYHVEFSEQLLNDIKNKDSDFYKHDYEKANDLFNHNILSIDSPDGGYWYKDYVNGIPNTTNPDYVGGQTVAIDLKYVGEDHAYNEVIPNHPETNDTDGRIHVNINGEEVLQTLPHKNPTASLGEEDTVFYTRLDALDYENSVAKGHFQFKKILTQKTGIEDGDNTGTEDGKNVPAEDIYFGVYLNRKSDQMIQDTTAAPLHLPDMFYASKRMDGLEYVFDANSNFEYYAEDAINSSVTGYHKATADEMSQRKGLVMIYTDQSKTTMKPAPEYYEWQRVDLSIHATTLMKLNTYVNPSKAQDDTALNAQNLSDKDLYMIVKTNAEGKAGSNMPETIVWANNAVINGMINTENGGSRGDWDYTTALKYAKSHAEDLSYLQETGLPLPVGTYTITEMNAPEGYEGVSWKAEITRNLTTYDINEDSTEWEFGIEKGVDGGYLRGNENPSGWIPTQSDVAGDGHAKDETWLNKQFHIFSDFVSTSIIGSNIEDKLHKQMLEIVKADSETGHAITIDDASFRIFQWNSNLALNDSYKHASYDNQSKSWTVTYDVPVYDANGETTKVTTYDATGYYTDSKGLREILGQWIKVPAAGDGIYTTDMEGRIELAQPLPVGKYFLLETKAPEGYLLKKEAIPFQITWDGATTEPNEGDFMNVPLLDADGLYVCQANKECNDSNSDDYAIDEFGNAILENVKTEKTPAYVKIIISAENKAQRGYLEVEKRGSIFDKFVQYTTDLLDMIGFKPTWKDDQVVRLNTSFCVYAEEDILINGDLKYKKDECIQKMSTNDEGHAYSEPLYLGKYYVMECDAPHGYITNQAKIPFELKYDKEVQIVHPTYEALVNERQKLQIEVTKSDEQGTPLQGAIFGIFAAEDLPVSFTEENISVRPTVTLLPQQMILQTHQDSTATLLGVQFLSDYRVIVPETATIDGEEYTLTKIGQDAFKGLQGIILPPTIEFVGDGAFLNNPDLDYLEFTSLDAPLFQTKNIFPTGSWVETCEENTTGIVCDLVFEPTANSLLGIYIPWNSLASYDLAMIGESIYESIADNEGSKDNRLMGVLLKDANNGHEIIDDVFNGIRFDTDGFSHLGKVANTIVSLDSAEILFELADTTKVFDEDEINGYFITNYKGNAQSITIPEAIIVNGEEIRVVGIDERAFVQKGVKEILLPDSIQYIGEEAFAENEELKTIRFYETNYQEYVDETNNGSSNVEDDIQMNSDEERCLMSDGNWKDRGDGTYACAYLVPAQKETTEEECNDLSGAYTDGLCDYEKEVFGEMPEEDIDAGGVISENEFEGMATLSTGACVPFFARAVEEIKSNSQLACEANGGSWDTATGTCAGGSVSEEVDDDMGLDDRTNSQIACEALGNSWDPITGTCSSEHKPLPGEPEEDIDPDFGVSQSRVPLYMDSSAFDYTPILTWIITSEMNYERFDQAFIISNDAVVSQDKKLDGYLFWNPEAINPMTGAAGSWDYGSDLPAIMEHPITLNQLINDDPIDGMEVEPPLPLETAGIPAGTLIEVLQSDANGRAVTRFDYPEGKYMMKELKAPEGYAINYESYPVELKYRDNDQEVLIAAANDGKPIINKKQEVHPLRIEVFKVDGKTLKGLSGAEFVLWNHDRSIKLETLVTDSTGHALTRGLYTSNDESSTYWLEETKAPEGYEINGDGWHEVKIDHNATTVTTLITVKNFKPGEPEEPEKPNPPTPSSKEVSILIQLIKSLEKDRLYGNEQAWKEVEFGIYAAEDIYSDSKKKNEVYKKDELIFKSGIDENGVMNVLWEDSKYDICDGDYYVKEIKTSKDYIINDHKYYFSYEKAEDGRYKVVEINDLKPIINELKRTHIQVMKVDEQNLDERLAEATFVLVKDGYDKNHDGVINELDAIDTKVSNEDGYATFNEVSNGVWWIKETAAPEGYEISTTWKKVTIKGTEVGIEAYDGDMNKIPSNDQGDIVTITWTNRLLPAKSEIIPPSTGDERNVKIYVVVFLLASTALVIYFKRRRNE